MSKERIFTWNEEKTIELGKLIDSKTVLEYMEHYMVDEFEARCSIAEMYLNEEEAKEIYQFVTERNKNDNGVRHSIEEVRDMCRERIRNRKDRLDRVDNHFKNVTVDEFKKNLIDCGIETIKSSNEDGEELI